MFFCKITLDKNFAQERLRARQLYEHAFHSILQRFSLNDISIGWLIPALLDSKNSPDEALTKINDLMEKNWFKIGLESDIESAYLLSREGELIGKWGITVGDIDIFSELFNQVVEKEQPVDQVLCSHVCTHIYVTPFLHIGEFIGVFVFAINLVETVIQMHGITGADIGILVKDTNVIDTKLPYLDKLSSIVVALTGYERNFPLLLALMDESTIDQLKNSLIFKYDKKSYEISTIPFIGGNETAKLIIIDDISNELADVQKAATLYAANGLLSLFMSGGILLLLISLCKFYRLIPEHAQGKYAVQVY